MQIGVVGTGNIGATVGELWIRAGHRVCFSSRHPDRLRPLVKRLGAMATADEVGGTIAHADVVLVAIPFGAWPDLIEAHGAALANRVVIDAGNPYAPRDGAIAAKVEALGLGSGGYVASLCPGMRLVRAFNTIFYVTLQREAHRPGDRVAIPIASSDPDALHVVTTLVEEAGFDALPLHGIERSRDFDAGAAAYDKALPLDQLLDLLEPDQPRKSA